MCSMRRNTPVVGAYAASGAFEDLVQRVGAEAQRRGRIPASEVAALQAECRDPAKSLLVALASDAFAPFKRSKQHITLIVVRCVDCPCMTHSWCFVGGCACTVPRFRLMDVCAQHAATDAITRVVGIVVGPKEPTQDALDRIMRVVCYRPLEALGPLGTSRLRGPDNARMQLLC